MRRNTLEYKGVVNMYNLDELREIVFFKADKIAEFNEQYFLCNSECNKWKAKKIANYSNGPIIGMVKEKDKLMEKYLKIPFRDNEEELDEIRKKILWLINKVKREGSRGKRYKELLDNCIEKICKTTSLEDLYDVYMLFDGDIITELLHESINVKMRYIEIYIAYEMREKEKCYTKIEELYGHLFEKDSDFKKYELIPIDEYRMLINKNPVRIYDKKLNKTIFISTPQKLAVILKELKNRNYIGNLAFRGEEVYNGKLDIEFFNEELEYGVLFNWNLVRNMNVSISDVTKLYSEEYDNQLWIRKEQCTEYVNLYFEELKKESDEKDIITTRMLHIKVAEKNGIYMIEHMDFEYIYYTKEEYQNRKVDYKIKGEAKKGRRYSKWIIVELI